MCIVYEIKRKDLVPTQIGIFNTTNEAGNFVFAHIERKDLDVEKVAFLMTDDKVKGLFFWCNPAPDGWLWEKAAP